jgi:hypothetical protein
MCIPSWPFTAHGQLVKRGRVIGLRRVKPGRVRPVDDVELRRIDGTGGAMLDPRPLGHVGRYGFTALDGLTRWRVGVHRGINPRGLPQIEDGVGAQQRSMPGIGLFLVVFGIIPLSKDDRHSPRPLLNAAPKSVYSPSSGILMSLGRMPTRHWICCAWPSARQQRRRRHRHASHWCLATAGRCKSLIKMTWHRLPASTAIVGRVSRFLPRRCCVT